MCYTAMPIGIVGHAFSAVWDDRDRLLLTKRTRAILLEHGYTASEIPALFFYFDVDKDGHLSLIEFQELVNSNELLRASPGVIEITAR